MKLLIVETPDKAKKIRPILKAMGPEWDVQPVMLTGRMLQFNIRTRGREVLNKLYRLTRNAEVYLATETGMEGETLAWYLQGELKLKNAKRIELRDFTWTSINASLAGQRAIDMELVYAFQERLNLERVDKRRIEPNRHILTLPN